MRPQTLLLVAVVVAAVVGFLSWAFWALYSMRDLGSWTGGSPVLASLIVLGVLGTAAFTGVFMWLAFYSSRKGYDEPPHFGKSADDV